MVLSNVGIEKAISEGIIEIKPLPPLKKTTLDTTALNLRLGNTLSIPKKDLSLSFDLKQGKIISTLSSIYVQKEIPSQGYPLEPYQFVLANTMEYISLNIKKGKPCYAARVEGKSSLARCGLLIHFTAPTIHAGFSGSITLELMNLGQYPIILRPGMQICQLIFETVEGKITPKESQFHLQKTPEGKRQQNY